MENAGELALSKYSCCACTNPDLMTPHLISFANHITSNEKIDQSIGTVFFLCHINDIYSLMFIPTASLTIDFFFLIEYIEGLSR